MNWLSKEMDKDACKMIKMVLLALVLFFPNSSRGQERYEFEGELPIYIDSIQKQLTYPMAWGHAAEKDFTAWRTICRAKVQECMLRLPPRAKDWDMQVVAQEQRQGYRAMKIDFNLNAWVRTTALVLVPNGEGPHPAINLLHDHGAHLSIGKEKMIRPFDVPQMVIDDADDWAKTLYEGQYLGDYLASHGYVVFSIDAPMWGDRGRKEGVDRKKYDLIAGNMMMVGCNLCAFMHNDDLLSTEFLATLPFVDANRIGCAGCSMGAYRAWMLSAMSDQVKVCCADCWMITTEDQLTTKYGRKENGGFANCLPGLRNYLDYPHLASMGCPKPTLFIAGEKDKLFPIPGVKKAFEQMQAVWDSQQAGHKLETYLLNQQHECNRKDQELILQFFNRWL